MEPSFWHERWRAGQIGFHRGSEHPLLAQFWGRVRPPGPDSRVFVPLCGKSLDLEWLRAQGHRVVGAELSPLAVRDFFAERGLEADVEPSGPFTRYKGQGLEIWLGDVFALDRARLGAVDAYYDRAALVALPAELRARYVAHLTSLLPAGCRGLLISFEYLPAQGGPPFSVDEAEVRRLYEPGFRVERLARCDILADEPRFAERGMTSLFETVFALERVA